MSNKKTTQTAVDSSQPSSGQNTQTNKSNKQTSKDRKQEFKLPKYLRLAKGAMWLDIDGDNASGVKLYSGGPRLIGRGKVNEIFEDGKWKALSSQPNIPRDRFDNDNFIDYGLGNDSEEDTSWYVDTSKIPTEKQSRLILAYKHKILVAADPKKPPVPPKPKDTHKKDFSTDKDGDLVFIGKNKEIYRKLQSLNFRDLTKFIEACPKTVAGKENLLDMYHYELKGYNKISRARGEILDIIRNKLKQFGPTMSSIRINED